MNSKHPFDSFNLEHNYELWQNIGYGYSHNFVCLQSI